MKYGLYGVQIFITLIFVIGLVFVFPIYLYANENVVTVEIIKFKFMPQEITIAPGTTVRWVNKEKRNTIASGLKR